jgi:hypothetical protein
METFLWLLRPSQSFSVVPDFFVLLRKKRQNSGPFWKVSFCCFVAREHHARWSLVIFHDSGGVCEGIFGV